MTRVLICDDHMIVRQGIRQSLAESPDIEVVAEAADGPAALEALLIEWLAAGPRAALFTSHDSEQIQRFATRTLELRL